MQGFAHPILWAIRLRERQGEQLYATALHGLGLLWANISGLEVLFPKATMFLSVITQLLKITTQVI